MATRLIAILFMLNFFAMLWYKIYRPESQLHWGVVALFFFVAILAFSLAYSLESEKRR